MNQRRALAVEAAGVGADADAVDREEVRRQGHERNPSRTSLYLAFCS